MDIKEMYAQGRYEDIIDYYETSNDLSIAKYAALSYMHNNEHEKMNNCLSEAYQKCEEPALRLEYAKILYDNYCHLYGEKSYYALSIYEVIGFHYYQLGHEEHALNILKDFYEQFHISYGQNKCTWEALNIILKILENKQDEEEILQYNQNLYEVSSTLYGYNDVKTLDALYNIVLISTKLGRYEEALLKSLQCFNLQKNKLGLQNIKTLNTYYVMACCYYETQQYQESYDAAFHCLELQKKLLGSEHPDVIKTMDQLTLICKELGDWDQCMSLNKELYDYFYKKGDSTKQVEVLYQIASIHLSQKEYQLALDYCLEAYHIVIENDKCIQYLTNVLSGIVACQMQLGNYQAQKKYAELFIKACERQYGEKSLPTIRAYEYLAIAYEGLKDDKNSLKNFIKCYELNKEFMGKNNPETIRSLETVIYSHRSDDLRNFKYIKEYFDYHQKYDPPKNKNLHSYYLMASILQSSQHYEESLDLCDQAYELLENRNVEEKYKGYQVLAQLYVNNKNFERYVDCIKKYIDNKIEYFVYQMVYFKEDRNYSFLTNDSFYQSLIIHFFEKESAEENYIYLIKIKNLLFNFERMKYLILKDANLQALLKEIDFYRGKLIHSKGSQRKGIERKLQRLEEKRENEISLYIQNFKSIDNCSLIHEKLQEGEFLLDFYQYQFGYGAVLIRDKDSVIYRTQITDADKMIPDFISTMGPYLKNVKHLYICPDGDLYNISFARYIDTEISYLDSPQSLLEEDTQSVDDDLDIVSVIYPDYYEESSESRGQKGILYGSYIEGVYINQLFKDNTLLSREDANHDNFLDIISPKILHISTHGEYVESDMLMDRGRLCLSGYNKTDHGYVTAAEIQEMDLTDTELVVLSACYTGKGESVGGEGIYGIRRAFELAGVKTLLLTVEEIDDYNAAIYMKIFYQYYLKTRNAMHAYQESRKYLSDYINYMTELGQFKNDFNEYLKEEIHPTILQMKLKGIDDRIEECMNRKMVLKIKEGQYIEEDWKGFIIQGKVHM